MKFLRKCMNALDYIWDEYISPLLALICISVGAILVFIGAILLTCLPYIIIFGSIAVIVKWLFF